MFSDLKTSHSLKAELSKDFIFDKICMAVTGYFLIYRELKWLKQEPLKAKSYIKRSISIAESFFPEKSPILSYLIQEYSQKYLKFKKHSEPIRSKSAKEGKNLRTGRKLGSKKSEKNGLLVKSQRNIGFVTGNESQTDQQLKPDVKISLGCAEKTEPEPQLSEESSEDSQVVLDQAIKLFSSDLYGDYYEEEPDKYEYMPLKRC